jgi:hypothetical protein
MQEIENDCIKNPIAIVGQTSVVDGKPLQLNLQQLLFLCKHDKTQSETTDNDADYAQFHAWKRYLTKYIAGKIRKMQGNEPSNNPDDNAKLVAKARAIASTLPDKEGDTDKKVEWVKYRDGFKRSTNEYTFRG